MRFNRIFLLLLCTFLLLEGCSAAALPKTGATGGFLDEVVFLGDSTTAHMQQRAEVAPTQVWATRNRYYNLDSRVTYTRILLPETGEELTVAEAVSRKRPPYLVITLGVDYGVYYYRSNLEKFRFYYEKLLDAIAAASPETVPVLQSVFPVARESRSITNDMIDRANGVIATIAKERGFVYVDANAVLKDREGYLKPAYCSSTDGIHLTAAAYDVILKNLAGYEQEIKEKRI
ncbi:MAG: hypothetical protein E7644_01810 [Ruminococcaceae bacterium]|nr:hypothetical protein [Oscillospiraceae bacterium]